MKGIAVTVFRKKTFHQRREIKKEFMPGQQLGMISNPPFTSMMLGTAMVK